MKYWGRKAAALLVLLALLVAMPFSAMAATVDNQAVQDRRDEIADLKQQEAEIKAKLDKLGDSIEDQKLRVNELNKQVKNLEAQIDAARAQVTALNQQIDQQTKQIEQLTLDIAAKEAELKETVEKLKKRLGAIAQLGNYSSLQLLMSTDNYAEYLLKTQIVRRVAEHDEALMNKAKDEKAAIAANRAQVEQERAASQANLAEAEQVKKALDTNYDKLDDAYTAANNEKNKLEQSQNTYEKRLQAVQKAEEELDREIENLLAGRPATSTYGGKMYWPVPTVKGISCTFGQKATYFHGGTDIWGRGCLGAPIVAAASGTVIKAQKMHYSYGNFVMIDHGLDELGRRIVTLYAHMRYAPEVSVGQTVTGGVTRVGVIGSTGESTGPHLHFEVRVNNKRVDPVGKGYIVKPS